MGNNPTINVKMLLYEVAFDLGCSSYAIGKIYDYFTKISNCNDAFLYAHFVRA